MSAFGCKAGSESINYEEGPILKTGPDNYPNRGKELMVPLVLRNACQCTCGNKRCLNDLVFGAQAKKMIDAFHKRIDKIPK